MFSKCKVPFPSPSIEYKLWPIAHTCKLFIHSRNIIAHLVCTRYTDAYTVSVDIVVQKRDNFSTLMKHSTNQYNHVNK